MNVTQRRLAYGLLMVVLLLPSIVSCAGIGSVVDSVAGPRGILRVAGDTPDTLDPALAQDTVSFGYLIQIYSGLVRLDSKLNILPDIAASWDVQNAGRTYVFHLKESARFQDGRAIRAEDVRYSFDRALNPVTRSPTASTYLIDIVGARERLSGQATTVSGIEVVDPLTLRLTIDSAKGYFLAKLTYATGLVVDSKNVASGPDWSMHPNGSGPFALKSLTPHDGLVLTRNARYFGTLPSLAEVDYYLGPESTVGLYQKGSLDVVTLGLGDIPMATDPENPMHNQLVVTPLLGLFYIGLQTRLKPFDDPKVRLAFAYATNKMVLTNGAYRGLRTLAHGIIPPGMPGFDPAFQGIPYDPEKARALLADSTYGSAANLPKISISGSPGLGPVLEGFSQMYHDNLGVDVAPVVLENSTMDDVAQGRAQMFITGWVADYPDPQDFVEILFGGNNVLNFTRYNNPQLNLILSEAQNEADAATRNRLYANGESLIVADSPAIPLYFDTEYDLVQPRVKGLTISPMGIVSFDGVTVSG